MNWRIIVIVLLSILLLGLANDRNSQNIGNQIAENTFSTDENSKIPQITITPNFSEPLPKESRFSGDLLTCTNLSDFEQVIDLRISNLDKDIISVSIDYPFSRTIELLPYQIKRIDLPLPYRVSSISLSSNDKKLTLKVPPCISRGGSSSSSSSTEQPFRPPPPVPELSTMALTGIGVFSLIFIISRSKQ